jgi:hypothetical protein
MAVMSLGPPSLAALQHISANLRARDVAELAMLRWDMDRLEIAAGLYEAWSRCLRAQVAFADGEPCAVLMLAWRTPAVLEAALLATDRWRGIVGPVLRCCRQDYVPAARAAGARRIECRTWAGHRDARGFLEAVGAAVECELPGYGRGGETFVQYALQLSA